MPLYTDANYYYSGGSSQLYSPYYPGSSSTLPISSSIYSPYTSTYNRTVGGSYVVPLATTRSSSYTSPHSLAACRYQPKLSTITESSPIINSARHTTLMPLTRIQSPKYTSYSASPVLAPKYVPPRPILINTADIDVSANRYRKRKEETLRQAQREPDYTSPGSSIKRRNSVKRNKEEEEAKLRNELTASQSTADIPKDSSPEQHVNRSTIKRNRAVVRLSTIRSRNNDRNKSKNEDLSSIETEKKLLDSATYQPAEEIPLKWREKLAADLATIPPYPNKKSPGELLREKYLIQDSEAKEDYAAQHRAQRMAAGLPKETIEQVILELDPLHHSIRRLSIPQCPTFHDICEDISSDKIDDDLNAGELRRRASIIQCQEQELLNELQQSASGTFQMITMERRDSHDSVDKIPHKRQSKRSSKKGKKIRTKITAIVKVENAPQLATILQKDEENIDKLKSPKPKFKVNVESVEEHQDVAKVFKLPKKKSIKRVAEIKGQVLPEGFMSPLPKPQISPKKKYIKPVAEIFTFDDKFIKQTTLDKSLEDNAETPANIFQQNNGKSEATENLAKKDIKQENTPTAEPLKTSEPLEIAEKPTTPKRLEKSSSINIELTTPTLPKSSSEKSITLSIEPKTPIKIEKMVKTIEKSKSLNIEQIFEPSQSAVLSKTLTPLSSPKIVKELPKLGKIKEQKIPTLVDNVSVPTFDNTLEKNKSLALEVNSPTEASKKKQTTDASKLKTNAVNIQPKTPNTCKDSLPESNSTDTSDLKMATPKPIKKTITKSDSGEDFWSQIGSRETLYMNKRKKEIIECQWKKREDLLECTNEEKVKNIEEIKSLVTSQKIEALKKADEDQKTNKEIVTRSNSNESALKKKFPIKTEMEKKEEKDINKDKDKNKIFPLKKKSPPNNVDDLTKVPAVSKDLETFDAKIKTNDKLNIAKTPLVTKMSNETSLLPSLSPSSPVTKTTSTEATSTTNTMSPKIIGPPAKSPEQQESAEKNKISSTTPAKSNNNKTETDMNKIATTTIEKQQLAKTFTLPTENAKITMPTSAAKGIAEATTTKQPETKQINRTLPITETNNGVIKQKTTATENKLLAADKAKSCKKSPTKTEANVINADQFIAKAPIKANISPVKEATKTAAPAPAMPSTTSPINATTNNMLDKKKKTTTTTSTNQTNVADTATTTTNKTSTQADDNQQICKQIKSKISADTNVSNNKNGNDKGSDETNNSSTCGSNLSKFATVSNLAQCLHDVDADLADYLPSSAEISENEDFNKDDSDFDYSSIDGWEKLTPSMKKKVKQRRRKEKQAEQARFDPQKKVKIDTTRKLYVKEEAPRFPLVATPRPLWKREKIVYPNNDSDDESDSEESGSTEETEDSDECTTSEEYEDELHPTLSGVGGGGIKSDSGASGDGGVSDSNKENSSIIRMSTCSNDSGFEGGTAPSSPKKMLECDVNCHKKCERLTANLCGVNQKLIVEALANVKRGARETRDSPSTPPSLNPAYKIEAIEEQDETSYTYSQFQKSGRFTPPATIIPRFKNYTVDDFHFLAVLGKGSFGKVLLAELRDTTYYYAVKCLKKDVVLEDDDVDSTLIERKVLALGTKHPYLCHLFCTFQTESHLFFVMEYLNGGDLMFHIQESGRFTEERARFYGAEIVSGLKFLHKKGIIYRDLKLDNVLLDYEGHVRIADFGMCKLQIYLDKTADSFCGTPDYMAPEIIKGDKYNQNVDWWSFGVLLYEMLIGQSPFSGCDEDELFWSICNELPWFPVYISAEATSILKGLLEKDYTKRIGSQYSPGGDIVEHIFFRPIDWNLLEKRQIEPPFRPQVKHPLDTQYFDRVFTRERVRLTPIDKDILQSMDQKQFLGFTYTNPHITLD